MSYHTVYKYTLQVKDGPQNPRIPVSAEIRHIGMQDGDIQIWAEVDTRQDPSNRLFAVYATGQPIKTLGSHIGTVQDGGLVWHIFEVY